MRVKYFIFASYVRKRFFAPIENLATPMNTTIRFNPYVSKPFEPFSTCIIYIYIYSLFIALLYCVFVVRYIEGHFELFV